MNRLSIIAMLFVFCCSCNFSKGVKKDLSTGLTTQYNGFRVEDAWLEDGNGNKLSSNKIPMGTTLLVVASGVSNFTEKNGRVYPGCQILLTDTAGTEMLNIADAFAGNTEGFKPEEATRLTATLNTGKPMETGATYILKTAFFDKQNKENKIHAELKIEMR
ncbi:MAG: hypothetical protein ACTHMC_14515 [Pseudobacter sp.]|uniref:hypothetical protein n=1 Tax=Pseudobacter sp. TaxID=2045420 RepID=UPI003F80697D